MLDAIIDYKLIGSRIKRRRKELNLTQETLANNLDMSVFYISKIENGKVSATLETLAVLAQYLNLDLSFLITGVSKLEKTHYIEELEGVYTKASNKQMNMIVEMAKTIIKN